MLKKITAVCLIVLSLMAAIVPASLAAGTTMYVCTQNGGPLNVRRTPQVLSDNLVGQLDFGAEVIVTGRDARYPEWVSIRYARGTDGTAWVMVKFLSAEKSQYTPQVQAEINQEMAAYTTASGFMIAARPDCQDGWVNLRECPSTGTGSIATLKAGQVLTVIGETTHWYHAIDSVTGRIGYVSKTYVYKV